MPNYSNPFVIGNTGQPPDRLGHNACFPEGLACDSAGRIYEVRGWDEAHDDIVRRDPGNGNIIWNSLQINPGHSLASIAVEPDGSWAYCGGFSEEGGRYRASIFRFNLADGVPREQRRTSFTIAGERIEVYAYGQIPTDAEDQTPLRSIAVYRGSIYVTDSYGDRVLKYDKITGVFQGQIPGLLSACGLAISPSGDIWVAHDTDNISVFNQALSLLTRTVVDVGKIHALSLQGDSIAVAVRTGGINTFSTVMGERLSAYGAPWRPGDGAANRIRELCGIVMLPSGEIVFSDRMGNAGRIQKIGGWVHLALELTSIMAFAKEKPERWISSFRQIYNVPTDGAWTLVGNGQTEPFSEKTYFGHFTSTDLGPPKLLKLGDSFFFYFPAGTSVGIYRVIEPAADRGPMLQICSAVGGAQPSPYGEKLNPTWKPENLYLWQWQDKTGAGNIKPEDCEILFAPGFAPGLAGPHWAMDAVMIDDEGTLWTKDGNNKVTKIALDGLNPLGNPVYKAQNRQVIFSEQDAQIALNVTDGIGFQMCSRVDGDVYLLCQVHNPAYPSNEGEWMAGNAIIAFAPDGTIRWGKILPFRSVGITAVSLQGGVCIGTNVSPLPGTVYHYDKDGNQLRQLRPDTRFGEHDPRIPSGGLDSRMSLSCQRDPRDGQVKVFSSDNLNQRIIVYSIDDGQQPQPPQPTMTANLAWDAAIPAPASYSIYKHVSGQTPIKAATSTSTTGSVPNVNEGDQLSVRSVKTNGEESVDSNKVTVNSPNNPPTNLRIVSIE